MSMTSGFFDSINHDRRYNAQQMSAIFDGIINDGVFDSVGGCLMVTPGTGLSVVVAAGRAWFDHTWSYNDTEMPLAIATAEMTLKRIDAVVLEVNNNADVRKNTLKIVQGVPATNPVKPTLLDANGVHQHALAYVSILAQATSITAAHIENVVGTDETPFVTGILETATIEALFLAWQEQFDDWFDNLVYVLDGDVAGHLQVEIDELKEDANKVYTGTDAPDSELGVNGDTYVKTR